MIFQIFYQKMMSYFTNLRKESIFESFLDQLPFPPKKNRFLCLLVLQKYQENHPGPSQHPNSSRIPKPKVLDMRMYSMRCLRWRILFQCQCGTWTTWGTRLLGRCWGLVDESSKIGIPGRAKWKKTFPGFNVEPSHEHSVSWWCGTGCLLGWLVGWLVEGIPGPPQAIECHRGKLG